MKLKNLFWEWAFLDFEHTCNKKQTYFGRYSEEIREKNLAMIRSLSVFFSIISVFVIIISYLFFGGYLLRNLYSKILAIQIAAYVLVTYITKKNKFFSLYNFFSSVYLLHILVIGAYIGTMFSLEQSATVFVATLVISQMLFILPPVITTLLAGTATLGVLIVSYHIKSEYFFKSDVVNCAGVFILSILLGWLVNRIRAKEAFARSRVLELNDELKAMSLTDQLTGLPNHRSFQDTYYSVCQSSQDRASRVGIIMLDIDKFKLYNDNYGHIEGDKCLNTIGLALLKLQNENLTIYRLGGEEFVALLREDVCDEAEKIAEEIREVIEKLSIPHEFSSTASVVTASLGIYAGIPDKDQSPMKYVDMADKAMYMSKCAGGNLTTVYETTADCRAAQMCDVSIADEPIAAITKGQY